MFNIRHHDLYMQDGADPPESILKNFMNVAENAEGAIAVHCKAGLGRTGTLIGAYLLKHYRMTAREAIAWIRICRPGSVIGHQQTWLENHEEILWSEGNEWRYKMYGKTEIVPFLPYGVYSFESPKRTFPGLRDLLTNLTKRARYRFILKNRPKRSRTRLEQTIKNILEAGKTVEVKGEEQEEEEEHKKAEVEPIADRKASYKSAVIEDSYGKPTDVQYLKAPPEADQPQYESESSQQEHQPKHSAARYIYDYPSVHRKSEYYNPNYFVRQEMYSHPSSFYSKATPQEMPKSRSADTPTKKEKLESGLVTQSVDRNWKRNESKYFPSQKFPDQRTFPERYSSKKEHKICAFDSRTNAVPSRHGSSGRQFLEQPLMEKDRYGKCENNRSGIFLSPEELQDWMESFEKSKLFQTQGDKLNAIKRSKVT